MSVRLPASSQLLAMVKQVSRCLLFLPLSMLTDSARAPSSWLLAPRYDEAAKRVPDYRLPITDC